MTSEQRGLYGAVQSEPALFKYLPFITPLLTAYDNKIRKCEAAYESLTK